MYDEKTKNLNLPLPHADNELEDDLPRIRNSFKIIDETVSQKDNGLSEKVAALEQNMATQEQATTSQGADIATQGAKLESLDNKLDTLFTVTTDSLTTVRTAVNGVETRLTNVENTLKNTHPNRPTLTAPAVGAVVRLNQAAMACSALTLPSGLVAQHVASYWEIYVDAALTQLIHSSGRSTTALTSYAANFPAQPQRKTLYGRVQVEDKAFGLSEWSIPVAFSTTGVDTPRITSPAAYATVSKQNVTLLASAFASAGNIGSHTSTSWYCKLNGQLVWSSQRDTANKTRIVINNAPFSYSLSLLDSDGGSYVPPTVQYTFSVQFHSNEAGDSAISAEVPVNLSSAGSGGGGMGS